MHCSQVCFLPTAHSHHNNLKTQPLLTRAYVVTPPPPKQSSDTESGQADDVMDDLPALSPEQCTLLAEAVKTNTDIAEGMENLNLSGLSHKSLLSDFCRHSHEKTHNAKKHTHILQESLPRAHRMNTARSLKHFHTTQASQQLPLVQVCSRMHTLNLQNNPHKNTLFSSHPGQTGVTMEMLERITAALKKSPHVVDVTIDSL